MILREVFRNKNVILTILGLSVVTGLFIGINQSINYVSTSKISDILDEVNVDVKIQINTSDYENQYSLMEERFNEKDVPILSSFQTVYSRLSNSVNISKDLQKINNITTTINNDVVIPKIGIYGVNFSKFFCQDRFSNLYNFTEGNVSDVIEDKTIIISQNLSINLSLNIGDSIKLTHFDFLKNISVESDNFTIIGIINGNSPQFSKIFIGPEDTHDTFDLGVPFSFSSSPFIDEFFILGNLKNMKNVLYSFVQEEIKKCLIFNIILNHDVEFFNFNQYRRQIEVFSNDLNDILREIDPFLMVENIYVVNTLNNIIDSIGDNLNIFELLMLLNLFPVFLFALIFIFFLRESSILTNQNEIYLLFLRGMSIHLIKFRLITESFLLSLISTVFSIFFGYVFKQSIIFFLTDNIYNELSLAHEIKTFLDSFSSYFIYSLIGFLIVSFSSISALKKHQSRIFNKTNNGYHRDYNKLNITMIIVGGLVPLIYYSFKIYKNFSYYSNLLEILNFLIFFIVTISPFILILGLVRQLNPRIMYYLSLIFQHIGKNKYFTFFTKNSLKSKKVHQVIPLMFLISFSFSYGIMVDVIQTNRENLMDQLIFNEIGGDFKFSVDLFEPYNSYLNNLIYETCKENNIETTEIISIPTLSNVELNISPSSYFPPMNYIKGISVLDYISLISLDDQLYNFTLLEELEKDPNNIIVSNLIFEEYSLKIGQNIKISDKIKNNSYNFIIIGHIDSLPALLHINSHIVVINKENPMILNELNNITNWVEFEYICKINNNHLSSSQAGDLFISRIPLSYNFVTREDIENNLHNPSLSFGIIYSIYSLLPFNSILVYLVSLIGFLVISNMILNKNIGNINLLIIRGIEKKEIVKVLLRFYGLLLVSSLILVPFGFLTAYLYFQSYNFDQLNLYYSSNQFFEYNNIFRMIIKTAIIIVLFSVSFMSFIYFKINNINIEKNFKYIQKE